MNSFDRLPQVPSDYANHYLWGTVLGLLVSVPAYHWLTLQQATLLGFVAAFIVAGGKKVYDYFTEYESISMCVAKTFVTAAVPALFYVESLLK